MTREIHPTTFYHAGCWHVIHVDFPRPPTMDGVAEQSMTARNQTSRQEEIVTQGRKRIPRACDKCSNSRTKCDGKHPWSARSIKSAFTG